MHNCVVYTEEILKTIEGIESNELREIFGERDECLKCIEERYGVTVNALNGVVTVYGSNESEEKTVRLFSLLREKIKDGEKLRVRDVRLICDMVDAGANEYSEALSRAVLTNYKGKQIRPKTNGQALYLKSILEHDIVFGIGPAGTGKTYLAVSCAVRAFKDRLVDKIILTRPAVEAGEKLGFLPGDLGAKVDPYLRPLYDALQEMFGAESYQRLLEKGYIEIAPLAYMRGRTLNNAFIILDEAQNSTREQMKMFLTRMGEGSKIVITGDLTQIDLPNKRSSGLAEAVQILQDVKGIDIVKLESKDVVRHELVMRIVNAYEKHESDLAESEYEKIDRRIGENNESKI